MTVIVRFSYLVATTSNPDRAKRNPGFCRTTSLPRISLRSMRLRIPGEQLREFRAQALPQIAADVDGDGKRSLELLVVRDAGIDENAVVEVTGQEQRIALGSPGLLARVDIGQRIEARAHRPQHLIEVAQIGRASCRERWERSAWAGG